MTTKVSGLGGVITVADSGGTPRTISNDITNFQFSTPRGVQDITGIDKSGIERILLLADFSVTLSGVADFAATTSAHAVFSTVPSTSVNRAVVINPIGTTSGNPKLSNNCLFTDYQMTRVNTGELTYQAPGVLADGAVPTWTVN